MSFLHPGSLWFGLLALPVVALFILKFRRKDQTVSSVLIWERVFKRKAITSLWQKLRKFLSLLLHLFILFFLTFALGNPLFSRGKLAPRYIAIVLDNSASMQSRDKDGKTFFARAKAEILSQLPKLGSDDKVLLIEARAEPRVVFPLDGNKRDLPKAVNQLSPSFSSADLPRALHFAIALLKPHLQGEIEPSIYLFSDGGGLPWTQIKAKKVGGKRKKTLATSIRRKRDSLELDFYTGRTKGDKQKIQEVKLQGYSTLLFEVALKKMALWGEKKFKEKIKSVTFLGRDFSTKIEVDPKKSWGGVLGELEKIPLAYHPFGAPPTTNLALTYFQVRKKFNGLKDYQVMVGVKNHGKKQVTARLSFYFQPFQKGKLYREYLFELPKTLKIKPGKGDSKVDSKLVQELARENIFFSPRAVIRVIKPKREWIIDDGGPSYGLVVTKKGVAVYQLESPLSDRYTKEKEIALEPLDLKFILKGGEEKTFFFPREQSASRDSWEKKGYQFQSGFHFIDQTYQGKKETQVFEGGTLKARVEVVTRDNKGDELVREDGFDADNRAYAIIPKPKRYMVYWVNGSSNEFLRALLANYQEVERMEIPAEKYLTIPPAGKLEFLRKGVQNKPPDLVIFDHCQPGVKLPRGKYIFINVEGKGVPVKAKRDKDGVPQMLTYPIEISKVQKDHRIMRFVNMEQTFILRCRMVERSSLPPGTEILIDTYGTPLLLAGKGDGRKWIYLAMDPRDSVMVLQNSFILLMTNSMEWLVAHKKGAFVSSVKTGDYFFAPTDAIWNPLGKRLRDKQGLSSLHRASGVGIYTIKTSPLIQDDSWQDKGVFVAQLADSKKAISSWLLGQFSKNFQKRFKKRPVFSPKLEEEINRLLRKKQFWKKTPFSSLLKNIDPEIFLKSFSPLRLNRLLLDRAYPQALYPYQEKYTYLASNLLNDRESQLNRTPSLELGEQKISRLHLQPKREIWSYLALLALILLTLEWVFFTRFRFF